MRIVLMLCDKSQSIHHPANDNGVPDVSEQETHTSDAAGETVSRHPEAHVMQKLSDTSGMRKTKLDEAARLRIAAYRPDRGIDDGREA